MQVKTRVLNACLGFSNILFDWLKSKITGVTGNLGAHTVEGSSSLAQLNIKFNNFCVDLDSS